MIHTPRIQRAIRFSIRTHEGYQKQKRKGKDVPYITHPLTVGLVLARAGASEDVIIAGILHDTIEDSIDMKKVTRVMLAERFGEPVAALVDAVTEQDKSLPWAERKREALEHIAHFSHEEVLVKSADVIANCAEILEDQAKDGDQIFERFHRPKEDIVGNAQKVIAALIERWPESPLKEDLAYVSDLLTKI